MAITRAQRFQACRLPVPDSDPDTSGDRFALAGAIQSLETATIFTKAQRWQVGNRTPIPDGDPDTVGDRYAVAGAIQSSNQLGPLVELFDLSYLIDPTWLSIVAETTGSLSLQIAPFVYKDSGTVRNLRVVAVEAGTSITNPTATTNVPSNIEIDDRTGFKVYPHWHPLSKIKEDAYGWRTSRGDDRHPQDLVRSRGNDKADGPQNAEPNNTFISTSVSPEDL